MNQYEMYYGLQVVAGDNKLSSAYEENAHIKGPKVICDYFLQNGNYLRLDNITVGWTPKLNTKWISSLRVYGTLKNVFTLTKYSGRGSYDRNDNRFVAGHWWHGCISDRT